MKEFSIKSEKESGLSITVMDYMWPYKGGCEYDDNWLLCNVVIDAGDFKSEFRADFLTYEFEHLLNGLSGIYHSLKGEYKFSALEGRLALSVSCDARGYMHFEIEAWDSDVQMNARLRYKIYIDQSYFSKSLHMLSEIVRAFPVRK